MEDRSEVLRSYLLHTHAHTHKHTALSEMHRSLVSAEVCMWLDPSHRQAKDNEKNSGVDGVTYVL